MATPYSRYGWNFFSVLAGLADPTWPIFDPAQDAPSGHGPKFSGPAAPSNALTGPGTLVILRGWMPLVIAGITQGMTIMHGDGVGSYTNGAGFEPNVASLGSGGELHWPLWNGLAVRTNAATTGRILIFYELPGS